MSGAGGGDGLAMVSAMACTCAVLTGSGSDATAASSAIFISVIVSGGNDAFEKSFISYKARAPGAWSGIRWPRHTNGRIVLVVDHHLNQFGNLVAR